MKKHENYDKWFIKAVRVPLEGGDIGFATCRMCGAAVLFDGPDDWQAAMNHANWHKNNGDGDLGATDPERPTPPPLSIAR